MRSRLILALLLCLVTVLLTSNKSAAVNTPLRVIEGETKASARQGQTEVTLAVENLTTNPLRVRFEFAWLDPRDRVVSFAVRRETIAVGFAKVTVPLQLQSDARHIDETLWYRLRYHVSPDTDSSNVFAPVTGLMSLSEIMPNIFELRAIASEYPFPGRPYRVHVRAQHPITARPITGVKIHGDLKFETDLRHSFNASGMTNGQGFVALDFILPGDLVAEEGAVEINGKHGEFTENVRIDLRADAQRLARIILTTDKPIYQPGQLLHIRAIAFDSNDHAIANAQLRVAISDPEGSLQFRSDLKTSRFGVASLDWQIPENSRLGNYQVEAGLDSDVHGKAATHSIVKIGRYDLPNFVVKTKPDRAYYLPGQNAMVMISGEYLFGRAVTKGRVRVVREKQRNWNYREQKWQVEQGESYEGEIDSTASFIARIDLTPGHNSLSEQENSRHEDLTYAAYFTDSTTGRTEQKRFDLRVTREAIHIYVVGLQDSEPNALPLQLYLSTSYADGTPAQCGVEFGQAIGTDASGSDDGGKERLRKIRTNRFGVAKLTALELPRRTEQDQRLWLRFSARDDNGRSGHFSQGVWLRDESGVRVETDKAVYRPGEPIAVSLSATNPKGTFVLSVAQGLQILESRVVQLRNGKAFVVLPFRREFRDEVTISAEGDDCCGKDLSGSRQIIYPRDRHLKLNLRLDAAQYTPGDEATTTFRVLAPNGRPVESALGVSIIDRAVEERALTESEFSHRRAHSELKSQLFATSRSVGGVTQRDLDKLDLTTPIAQDMQLAAEVLLFNDGYTLRVEGSRQYSRNPNDVFGESIRRQYAPLRAALEKHFKETGQYPKDPASLASILQQAGLSFDAFRDPWGVPYRPRFSLERDRDHFSGISAGADKRFDTSDDFNAFNQSWSYFARHGEIIHRIAKLYSSHTGGTTRDATVFEAHLVKNGLDFAALRDPWGNAYAIELDVIGTLWNVRILSSGPNGRFETTSRAGSDDFSVWIASVDYFDAMRARIESALAAHFRTNGSFPENDLELISILHAHDIELEKFRDQWGNGLYVAFLKRYRDRVVIHYTELSNGRTTAERINYIELRSLGPDRKESTFDDWVFARFSRFDVEKNRDDRQQNEADRDVRFPSGAGAIKGTITDGSHAAVPAAIVGVRYETTQSLLQTKSDAQGGFLIPNLPSGRYQLQCAAVGFKVVVVEGVLVRPSTTTEVSLMIEVGTLSETVVVTADAPSQMSAQSSVSVISKRIDPHREVRALDESATKRSVQASGKFEVSTPRLREHFQETLVWRPQLETDARGRAQLKFKLGDNISTWKLAVVASTIDGQIGYAEKEFLAFQPFFAEHEPPRVLTEGDEIALPVVLRNYLDKAQTVTATMKPESWFALLGAPRKLIRVAGGDSARAIFDFRVTASISDGKQRVTAIGGDASDAVEKPVSVHPEGEELAQTVCSVFDNRGELDVSIPADMIRGSLRAELKIYPDLMSHALEGIEGILQRPHGCGEQTISSTYPNVMALRYLRQQDESTAALAAKASRYAKAGYERLLSYRAASGGFSYWGRGEADLALTAYAMRFLNDASEFVDVGEDVIVKARAWVIGQQQPDGSWWPGYAYSANTLGIPMTTAYIARVLASEHARAEKPDQQVRDALKRAFGFLAPKIRETDEPYLIASYAIAAMDSDEHEDAAKAIARLRGLARHETGTAYWQLNSTTPFYGWGVAGRIETTALAVRALHASRKEGSGQDELADRGLLYLLRNKDRHGVWLSTQATINVLDTLLARYEAESVKANAGGRVEILVNGDRTGWVELPPGNRPSNALLFDLSSVLRSGVNRIALRREGEVSLASAQIVETHYAPWKTAAGRSLEPNPREGSKMLRLAVTYDKPQAGIGDEVTCNVLAERNSRGVYGMMLAEIGLPPGADVDRASLEKAMKESGWELNQYDVLPDRVILYLWPRDGGTRFSFKFRLRYGIRAQSAPSVLYDYYNPEARTVVTPTFFVVR